MPFTMLFSFYNHPQPLQVWADRTSLNPRKWSLHVDTERRVNASIKEKKNQWKREGGLPNEEVLKKERKKNTKLLRRGLKSETTHAPLKEGLVRHVRLTFM